MHGQVSFFLQLIITALKVFAIIICTLIALWVISGVGLALLVFVWHGHPVWTGVAGTFFVGLPLLFILDYYLPRK